VALNDVIPARADVAMLLVDVENFELEALQGASIALNACRVHHILLSNVKISGDIFAKLRTVLALVNRCNYRAYKFQEQTNAKTLSSLSLKSIQRDLVEWIPGASWPAQWSLWLYLSNATGPISYDESRAASL